MLLASSIKSPAGLPCWSWMPSTKPAMSLARPYRKPPLGVQTSLSKHCQPANIRRSRNRSRPAKNLLVSCRQVADMYMSRALGKLYKVHRARDRKDDGSLAAVVGAGSCG